MEPDRPRLMLILPILILTLFAIALILALSTLTGDQSKSGHNLPSAASTHR